MMTDFDQALEALSKDALAISVSTLSKLSAPSHGERAAFAALWPTLALDSRRAIIARMYEVSEESIDLDFWDLFRLCLTDDDAEVRVTAIEGLWEDERADLVAVLLRLVAGDPSDQVRAAAASALGRFVYLAECEELEARHAVAIRETLERIVLDHSQPIGVARRALESLSHISDERVRGMIDWAYEQGDELLRASAVFAMGRSADALWADHVLEELLSDSLAVRYEAAHAAGEIQIQRGVEPLIALARGSDPDIRAAAIWSLGQIGGQRARQALEQLAASTDEDTALAAEEAIAELEFCTSSMDLLVAEVGDEALQEEPWSEGGASEEDLESVIDEDDAALADDEADKGDEWDDEPLALDSE